MIQIECNFIDSKTIDVVVMVIINYDNNNIVQITTKLVLIIGYSYTRKELITLSIDSLDLGFLTSMTSFDEL